MATDAWQTARTRVLRLFRREGDEAPVDTGRRLDADRGRLERTADDTGLREELTALWREQLLDLLRDQPDRADELRGLTQELGVPAAPAPDAKPAQIQHVTAHSNGVAIGVQGGDAHYHAAPAPPPGDEGGRAAR